MRVLVTGAGGLLGQALLRSAPGGIVVRALARAELDIADAGAVSVALRELRCELVINAAAFTRVDAAESQSQEAQRVNAIGPAVLAAACRASGAWLAQVSTDYVFDGAQSEPYVPSSTPNPLNVYGRSKLAGERAVIDELGERCTVVRTSWVYGTGHRNFVTTMLDRFARPEAVRVVSDQIGVPTHVAGLARVLWALCERRAPGMWHWSDSGVASWYDFAVAIAEESTALRAGAAAPPLVPIRSAEYPSAARRPRFSVLDKHATEDLLGMRAPHWRVALREVLAGTRAAPEPRA
jgi:dTDP-4-dehydrorhamnose reductase